MVAQRYKMATATTMKVPPVFKENENDYVKWKKDLQLWSVFTDLPKEKMGIAVHLSLSGRARQATSEISVEEMKSAESLDVVLKKLNRVFLQDKN